MQTGQKPPKEEAGSRHSPLGVLTKVRPPTPLPFSVHNRPKGSVSHCITFLTISKGSRGGSQMHNSRQWALPTPLPQEAVFCVQVPAEKCGGHCTRGSRRGSLGTSGGDTLGHCPRPPPLPAAPPGDTARRWLGWRARASGCHLNPLTRRTWGPRGRPPEGERPGLGG